LDALEFIALIERGNIEQAIEFSMSNMSKYYN